MNFTAELEGYDEVLKLLDKKTINKVLNQTANDEGRRFNTQVAKDIRAEYNIKSSDIKSKVKIKRAKGDDNSFEITISSPRLSLAKFVSSVTYKKVPVNRKGGRYRGRRQFVKVKVKRGKSKLVRGGFYAKGQLFKREEDSSLPLKRLTTLSITGMFTEEIVDKGFKKVEENYPKTLKRKLNFYISK